MGSGFIDLHNPLLPGIDDGSLGRTIIFAHPERYWFAPDQDPLDHVRAWRDAGAVLQVSGGSVMGRYTAAAHRIAGRMLAAGRVDIIATDHHGDARPHHPSLVAEAVTGKSARRSSMC